MAFCVKQYDLKDSWTYIVIKTLTGWVVLVSC